MNNEIDLVPDLRQPKWFRMIQQLGPILALGVVILIFSVLDNLQEGGGTFLSLRNAQVILSSTAVVAVAALGMTMIIISGGIDLSSGTSLILSASILAYLLKVHPSAVIHLAWILPIDIEKATVLAAILHCLGVGVLCGLFNGILVSCLKIVPFIVTLGTMTIYMGLAKYVCDQTTIRPPLAIVPDWLDGLISTRPEALYFGVSLGVWIALVLAIVVALVLRYTVFGRYIFALGSNESTARLCGVNVPVTKILTYAFAGLFVGVAGIYQFTKLKSVNPTAGAGMELRVIAAVVIGGGSLNGGQGSVIGTLTGALIMGVIYSGCTQLGVRNLTTDIIIGVIIIVAVSLDQLRQQKLASN